MNKRITLTFSMIVLFVIMSFGQNGDWIKEKFGQPVKVYSVSEHIWMTPEYTKDGQVCTMRLFSKHISSKTIDLTDQLDVTELRQVLNEIIPDTINKRGQFGFTSFAGRTFQHNVNYENVIIYFLAPLRGKIKITKSKNRQTMKSESEKQIYIPPTVEIVVIRWRNRTCVDETE